MKVKLEKFQESCKIILGAVDNKLSTLSQNDGYGALEIVANGCELYLNTAVPEYYVSIKLDLEYELTEPFRAVIDAKIFFKLISRLTSEYIDLEVNDNVLVLTSSGEYLFPLKTGLDGDLIHLPTIDIGNVTSSFEISSDVLNSILRYNLKELESCSKSITRPVQSLLYLDESGCIAWTQNSLCVNAFKLSNPVKVLLSQKLVKLFKLFKAGDINFSLGFQEVGAKLQTRVRFTNDTIDIVAIADNDVSLMNTIPLTSIRGLVEKTYPYSVNFKTEEIINALQRLMLFDSGLKTEDLSKAVAEFDSEKVTIKRNGNSEVIYYDSTLLPDDTFVSIAINPDTLGRVLENSEEQFIVFNFGPNEKAIMMAKGNVRSVIQVK